MFSIMIVDDEVLVRQMLHRFVDWHAIGIDAVYEAENGMRALEMMKTANADIVISDMRMPHMDGMDFATQLRSQFPDSRLVFLSGYTDKEYLKHAIHLHADAYIEKPLNIQEISKTISELVELQKKEYARKAPQYYFFRGETAGAPLNHRVFELSRTQMTQLTRELKSKNYSDAMTGLRNVCSEIRICEATAPEYIRSVYSKLADVVETAAEFHGAAITKAQCDQFAGEIPRCRMLSELEEGFAEILERFSMELYAQQDDPIVKINNYLQANYTDSSLSVESIAHALNYNTSYLCALYKQRTGRTIMTSLTTLRMEHACMLLKHSTKKLYEVGRCVGYTNGKYFVKLFTREIGLTPREYRERHL